MTDAEVMVPPARDVMVKGVAEQLAPIVRLHAELAGRWRIGLDVERARARLLAGQIAYDPMEAIASAGNLLVPYIRATAALELAGMASAAEATEARERRFRLLPLIAGWLAGEPPPRERARHTAFRAAALIASSVLRHTSAEVKRGVALDGWLRADCPCCGGHPDFAVREAGTRRLICARCDAAWPTRATGCIGCGASTAPAICHVASAAIGYELVICNACGRYLKEPLGRSTIDPIVERAITAQLDAAAESRGLRI